MTEVNIQETQVKFGSLKSTFELKTISGKNVPFQNNIPYPSFEPQNREVVSLAGTWRKQRFDADHDWSLTLRDEKWIAETVKSTNGIPLTDFDDSNWETHSIPLPENHMAGKEEVNGAETYENGVWYRRSFRIPAEWEGKVITLKALAVSYIGDFWVNGQYIGYHEGGYTPFAFDITKFVETGDNIIAVRIDNPPWTSRVDILPAQDNDFFNYTGIIHDMYLEATEAVHVVRTDIVPKNPKGNVEVSILLENRSDKSKAVTLKGTIYETDIHSENWLNEPGAASIRNEKVDVEGLDEVKIELAANEVRVVTYQVKIANPKLWSIRKPNLYIMGVELVNNETLVDSFYTQFGIRTLKTEKAQILLNEKPIFLAGVARHEEWRDYGRTASWDRIRSDFLTIADLSVNMVRTAHYPNHVYTFIMLDRLGLTSMSEIPLWQFETIHYQAQEERGISYQMWREMVYSRFNSPSVIMWSTQNESKDVMLRKAYNENLVNELRSSYNDGRLITQSSAADQPGYWDESMEPLDVMGWTMYFGIFHGSTPYEGTRNFIEKAHERWPEKPILNTEYGIWSNADDSFLEKQVEIYRDVQLALIEKATVNPQGQVVEDGYVAGMDYWTAFDWFVNHNRFYQTMGMLRMDRETQKPLYHEFVRDHQRLMGTTYGMAESVANKPLLVNSQSRTVSNGTVKLQLDQTVDFSEYNYLVLTVSDPENEAGVTVNLINEGGAQATYSTYGIQVNKPFDVYVPLWTLDQLLISTINELEISFEENREIEVLDVKLF